jgi:hypothetical protein
MSRLTELGAARLPDSGGDLLIMLSEPDGMPASLIVHWPGKPTTITDLDRFGDLARIVVRLFSEAHIALAGIRRERQL